MVFSDASQPSDGNARSPMRFSVPLNIWRIVQKLLASSNSLESWKILIKSIIIAVYLNALARRLT